MAAAVSVVFRVNLPASQESGPHLELGDLFRRHGPRIGRQHHHVGVLAHFQRADDVVGEQLVRRVDGLGADGLLDGQPSPPAPAPGRSARCA